MLNHGNKSIATCPKNFKCNAKGKGRVTKIEIFTLFLTKLCEVYLTMGRYQVKSKQH